MIQSVINNNYEECIERLREGHTILECQKNKTPVYYAIINNYRAYITIYEICVLLEINNVVDFFKNIECVCDHLKTNNKNYYDSFMNYRLVNDYLKKELPKLINQYPCAKEYKVDLVNVESCVYDFDSEVSESINEEELINELTSTINWYFENSKIVELLLNQQGYEVFKSTGLFNINDIDYMDYKNSETILIYAVKNDYSLNIINKILCYKPDIVKLDHVKKNALIYSVEHDRPDIAKRFLEIVEDDFPINYVSVIKKYINITQPRVINSVCSYDDGLNDSDIEDIHYSNTDFVKLLLFLVTTVTKLLFPNYKKKIQKRTTEYHANLYYI